MTSARASTVVFDTDLATGLPGMPLDSGLALLYLLGTKVVVDAVTIVAGRTQVPVARDCAAWVLRLAGRSDIAVISGSELSTEAAEYMVRRAAETPHEVFIVATGPLSNIKIAAALDPAFLDNLAGVVITGGCLRPPQVPGWNDDWRPPLEHDPEALSLVLDRCRPVISTVNLGTLVRMSLDDAVACREYSPALYHLLKEYLLSVVAAGGKRDEMYLPAVASAMCITRPELFVDRSDNLRWNPDTNLLEFDRETGNPSTVLTRITSVDDLFAELHGGWATALSAPTGALSPAGGQSS